MNRISACINLYIILTRCTFGLLPVFFFIFVTELWPFIDDRILFPSISVDIIYQILYMH